MIHIDCVCLQDSVANLKRRLRKKYKSLLINVEALLLCVYLGQHTSVWYYTEETFLKDFLEILKWKIQNYQTFL